jgi:hypothetical protein
LITSIGVTTRIASVVPAPIPAIENVLVSSVRGRGKVEKFTKEDSTNTRHACFFVGEPTFVRLERRETDRHLGNYTAQDCPESFVERKRSFAANDGGSGSDERAGFGLSYI